MAAPGMADGGVEGREAAVREAAVRVAKLRVALEVKERQETAAAAPVAGAEAVVMGLTARVVVALVAVAQAVGARPVRRTATWR